MFDPNDVEDVIRRGRQAAQILGSEAFVAALAEVEQDTVADWVGSVDLAAREAAHGKIRALNAVRDKLALYVNVGEGEQERLKSRR